MAAIETRIRNLEAKRDHLGDHARIKLLLKSMSDSELNDVIMRTLTGIPAAELDGFAREHGLVIRDAYGPENGDFDAAGFITRLRGAGQDEPGDAAA
jgi:hypothetical protein